MTTATASITRSFEAKIDDVSKPRRTVTAKVNTSIVDRYRTVISPVGGDWRNYMSSGPAVLWEHGKDPVRGRMPVAHCDSLKYRRMDDDLVAVMRFKDDEYSQRIFDHYAEGTLVSFSIEFLPDEAQSSRPTREEVRDRPDWKDAEVVYRKWEMTGLSAVSYPGNPQAVALAVERGLWVPEETKIAIQGVNLPEEPEVAPEAVEVNSRAMSEGGGSQGGYLTKQKDDKGEKPGDPGDDEEPDEDEDDDEDVKRYITHDGDQWVVHAEDGKVLGKHPTKAQAVKQLQAIEAHKHAKDAPKDEGRALDETKIQDMIRFEIIRALEERDQPPPIEEEPPPALPEPEPVQPVIETLPLVRTFTLQELSETIVEQVLPITRVILALQAQAHETQLRDLSDLIRGRV